MDKNQAEKILGTNRAKWELKQIIKALSKLSLLNTIEDDDRLQAAKILLKN